MFIDFSGHSIRKMVLNGEEIKEPRLSGIWQENKLWLPTDLILPSEDNVVEFVIENRFNNDQFGLVRARDPSGEEYCFVQTVPYYASRVVPFFDQPDLKATFLISVAHAPSDSVITTGELVASFAAGEVPSHQASSTWLSESFSHFSPTAPDSRVSCFERTPLLSSYLFNLVCGPFTEITASPDQIHKDVQMKIYCRSRQD